MKKISIIASLLFSMIFFSCEEYHQGEYVIVNNCKEAIDCYTVGKNINSPSVGIHDHIPANNTLLLRRIEITEKATLSNVFKSI
jgi:hypothetical protein